MELLFWQFGKIQLPYAISVLEGCWDVSLPPTSSTSCWARWAWHVSDRVVHQPTDREQSVVLHNLHNPQAWRTSLSVHGTSILMFHDSGLNIPGTSPWTWVTFSDWKFNTLRDLDTLCHAASQCSSLESCRMTELSLIHLTGKPQDYHLRTFKRMDSLGNIGRARRLLWNLIKGKLA